MLLTQEVHVAAALLAACCYCYVGVATFTLFSFYKDETSRKLNMHTQENEYYFLQNL